MKITAQETPSTTVSETMLIESGFTRARVTGVRAVAEDVIELSLDGRGFAPGDHLEVAVPATLGDYTIRHYSLSGTLPSPQAPWTIAVRRCPDGDGGSLWLHDAVDAGDELLVRGPRNTFPFGDEQHVLLIAGGIGVTPLLPMAEVASREGRQWHLLYVGKVESRMPYAVDLKGRYGDAVTVRTTSAQGRPNLSEYIREWVNGTSVGEESSMAVYVCGPIDMVSDTRIAAEGVPSLNFVYELFDPDNAVERSDLEGADPAVSDNLPFTVELADGTEVPVSADETILSALGKAGVRTLSSCQRGTCGTCETFILEGEVDHRDSVLSDEDKQANESMMICVSRAKGDRICLDL